jgi:hypothetical protein
MSSPGCLIRRVARPCAALCSRTEGFHRCLLHRRYCSHRCIVWQAVTRHASPKDYLCKVSDPVIGCRIPNAMPTLLSKEQLTLGVQCGTQGLRATPRDIYATGLMCCSCILHDLSESTHHRRIGNMLVISFVYNINGCVVTSVDSAIDASTLPSQVPRRHNPQTSYLAENLIKPFLGGRGFTCGVCRLSDMHTTLLSFQLGNIPQSAVFISATGPNAMVTLLPRVIVAARVGILILKRSNSIDIRVLNPLVEGWSWSWSP